MGKIRDSVNNCCVQGCVSKRHQYRLHTFPRNRSLLKAWKEKLNIDTLMQLEDVTLEKLYRVCERHFRDSDYQNSSRTKLNRGVIPTLHLGGMYKVFL